MGESAAALLANLYSAAEPSCWCFELMEVKRSRSKSRPELNKNLIHAKHQTLK
jgi:hypothetical protein